MAVTLLLVGAQMASNNQQLAAAGGESKRLGAQVQELSQQKASALREREELTRQHQQLQDAAKVHQAQAADDADLDRLSHGLWPARRVRSRPAALCCRAGLKHAPSCACACRPFSASNSADCAMLLAHNGCQAHVCHGTCFGPISMQCKLAEYQCKGKQLFRHAAHFQELQRKEAAARALVTEVQGQLATQRNAADNERSRSKACEELQDRCRPEPGA